MWLYRFLITVSERVAWLVICVLALVTRWRCRNWEPPPDEGWLDLGRFGEAK